MKIPRVPRLVRSVAFLALAGLVGPSVLSAQSVSIGLMTARMAHGMNTGFAQGVGAGHRVSFRAIATGDATSFQWQVSTNGGLGWVNLQDDANHQGAMTDTMTATAALAMNGNLYRVVATTASGTATSAAFTLRVGPSMLASPSGLAIDALGNCWVSDSSANFIARVSPAGSAMIHAGMSGQQGSTDGAGTSALFRQPRGMAVNAAGELFVADTGNSLIRKITPEGMVTTLAGSPSNQGHRDGAGMEAWFNAPASLVLDFAGNLYVADTGNSAIRQISRTGLVTTLAGVAGTPGGVDGPGATARFNHPAGIAISRDGILHVADTFNHTIRRITPAGVVTTWVGLMGVSGSADGSGSNALFNQPMGLTFDAAGNLYVADAGNATIRCVTPAGVVSTLAGLSSMAGLMDGMGSGAWFNRPKDVKFDGTDGLFVADFSNAEIRRVSLQGAVSTLAISPASTAPAAGPASSPGAGPSLGSPSAGAASGGGGGGAIGLPALAAIAALLGLRQWRRGAAP